MSQYKPEILVEDVHDSEILSEENSDGGKNYYIQGIFMQSEKNLGNHRKYPKRVLSEAVNDYRIHYIERNRGYGELGHPKEPKINLERVCVLTQEIMEDGNNFIGKAKVVEDLPYGKIVKAFLKEGVSLGVSSRGVGHVRNGIVQNGFKLKAAIDVVADPSAPDAYVDCLVENRVWIEDETGRLVEEFVDEVKKTGGPNARTRRAEALQQFFTKLKG